MNTDELKSQINTVIEREKDELFSLNRWIFDRPEISGQEFETSRKVVEYLREKGFTVEYPFAGIETAFSAVRPGTAPHGRRIAILTEYDALPELGHACGHSLSCCISLLAGLCLAELQDELDADVHIIGTPGEETCGAKVPMTDAGIFDGFDMAIMVHLYNCNVPEPDTQAVTPVKYFFHGKAAHAGVSPWEGRNALNAAQLFLHAVDMLRQHILPECRIHGFYRDGGAAVNIVPDEACVEMHIRSRHNDVQKELVRLVDDCAKGAAIATQCSYESDYSEYVYEALRKNENGGSVLRSVYEELGLPLNAPDSSFAATDAGNVSRACPAFQPCLQLVPHEISIHQREFAAYVTADAAFEALQNGARIIAFSCLRIFTDHELYEKMKAEHAAQKTT